MIGNAIAGLYGVGVTPSTTAYESIATITIGSGGAANAEFTSIPSTYTHLQIRGIARGTAATTVNLTMQYNSDTATNYTYHLIEGNGSTAAAFAGSSLSNTYLTQNTGSADASGIYGVFVSDILDYANTNKFKTNRNLTGYDRNGSGGLLYWSGLWRSTSAITSIKITPDTGNIEQYSQFALYGIKGA